MRKLQFLLMCCLAVGFAACDDDKDIDKGVDNDIDFGDVNVKVGELKDTGTQLIWAEQSEDYVFGQVVEIITADYEGDEITALKEVLVFSDTYSAETWEKMVCDDPDIKKVSRDGNKVTMVYEETAISIYYESASVIRMNFGSGGSSTPIFKSGTENGHDYVDLGLTSGTKWATANVGASKPQHSGNYYAWGETSTSAYYYWPYYKYGTYDYYYDIVELTKYKSSDSKTILDLSDDAAYVNWGGKWRMPTKAQQDELRSQCYWVWTDNYNNSKVKGYIVYKAKTSSDKGVKIYEDETPSSSYSLSDAHIFLPAAGYRLGDDLNRAGSDGVYWSSSLDTDDRDNAWSIDFRSGLVSYYPSGRCHGYSVRAVIPGE